jgi:hypothetical protein
MAGRDWTQEPFQLIIPPGAGPGDPRIEIGTVVPAELNAYYANAVYGTTVVAAILEYADADTYHYDAVLQFAGGAYGRATGWSIKNQQTGARVIWVPDRVESPPVIDGAGTNFNPSIFFGINDGLQPATRSIFYNFDTRSAADFAGRLTVDGISTLRGYRDAMSSTAGSLVTSTGAEIAVPSAKWSSEPIFTFVAGRLYKCSINICVINSAATVGEAIVRIRKGAATIVGTQLIYYEYASTAGIATFGPQANSIGYIKNTTAGDVSTKLSATIQRGAGAGNFSLYGDVARPAIITVEDIGIASEQPGIIAVSV